MPNLLAITLRTQEIVQDRTLRWLADLQAGVQDAGDADTSQRQRRAEYEAAAASPDPSLRQQFEQKYGADAWTRQETLYVRRDRKAGQP